MARRIFISYKYSDSDVLQGRGSTSLNPTTARDYVDTLQGMLSHDDNINMGENDDESLEGFKDETIESKLRTKIYWSSTTIILISKGMRDPALSEDDQWIPWEVAWSLKNITREGRTSGTNAMAAVVLPDRADSYTYFFREGACRNCNVRILQIDRQFRILRDNMFNRKQPRLTTCSNHEIGGSIHTGDDHSYIYSVKWDDFDIGRHLDVAWRMRESLHEYNISKQP